MRLTCKKLSGSLPGIFLLFFLFQFYDGFSQGSKTFRGIVTDARGQAVEGASVTIKETTGGFTKNREGNFNIEAQKNSTAIITSVGYRSREILLKGNTSISIKLDIVSG